MINITYPISFYDDTNKTKEIVPSTNFLYSNERVCLCMTKYGETLFDIETGEVLTKNLEFWYATNEIL